MTQVEPGTTPVYVALGDSISIDDYAGGPGRGGASLFACNADDDFPEWRGKDLRTRLPGLDWHVLAMDGATSLTVLAEQLPRLEALTVTPSVVTMTIGGNDLLLHYGDTRAARRAVREVQSRVETTLARVEALTAANVSLIVGTVYDPSDGTGDGSKVGLPSWPDVVDVVDELNSVLRSTASRNGAGVAEIHDRFLGHGIACGNPVQSHPRPANRSLWYCNVIEPNAWGASQVRAAFWEALDPA